MTNNYIDTPCPCTGPGFCPHYGILLGSKLWSQTRRLDDEGRKWRQALAGKRPAETPSLFRQAANFAGAVVRHVAAGCPTVSEEEKSRRMALCLACEHYVDGRCAKCGCFTAAKAAWAGEKCPVGKW